MDGRKIALVQLLDLDTDKTGRVQYDKFVDMVKKGIVQGYSFTELDGEEFICGEDKQLFDEREIAAIKYSVEERIISDGSIAGYRISSPKSKESKKVSAKRAWQLGSQGILTNAEAYLAKQIGGEELKEKKKVLIVDLDK